MRIGRALWPVLVLLIGWTVAASADDALERTTRFEITAAPLANALVQFSAQSGVQVAVADADVAHLQSQGLHGDYSARDALQALLLNTGLSFAPAGATAVAIRAGTSGPLFAGLTWDSGHGQQSTRFPDVTVIAPPAPSAAELSNDGLFPFIVHHASTHYSASAGAPTGGLLRWRGGRSETVCPETSGLGQEYDDFVSARVRALAAFVGAPVHSDTQCVPNVHILFTTQPRSAMQWVLDRGAHTLGVKFPHQMEKELDVSGEHAIQGWYITAGGGASVLNADPQFIGGIELQGLWPRVIPSSAYVNGNSRSILTVFLAVDSKKVAGYAIGAIADYLAVATLTVVQSPDHCDPLPSILDLMAPSCGSRAGPTGVTAGDVAFLKALYYRDSGLGRTLSRDEIENNMLRQLRGR